MKTKRLSFRMKLFVWSLGYYVTSPNWIAISDGIWKWCVIPKFVTVWVIPLSEGFMVRINGTEVQKTYSSLEEAKTIGLKAVKKLNDKLTEVIS